MQEQWKDIEGFEGKYQVSNFGNVKTLERQYISGKTYKVKKTQPEKLLSQKRQQTGYCVVLLYGERRHYCLVHRLVAQAFLDNPENKPCVNHIDGNKQNNNVDNLEWVTKSENTQHAIKLGLRKDSNMRGKKGILNKLSKKVYQYDLQGNLIKEWACVSDVARHYAVTPSCVANCARGLIKTVKGYKWNYAVLKSQD